MLSLPLCRIFALLGLGLSAYSCTNLQEWVGQLLPAEPTALNQYVARDGQYFPDFIQKFFPATDRFVAEYPSLAQAASGMLLVSVKRLNEEHQAFNEANLSWSADSVYLGYEIITGKHRKILVKDLVGNYSRELLVLEKGPEDFLQGMVLDSIKSYNAGLKWSYDSNHFVFMSNGGNGEYNLYLGGVGIDGRALSQSQTKDGYAAWNPKGEEIAFVSARSGNGDIYTQTIHGNTTAHKVSGSGAVDIFPEWFPDGQKIVYSSGEALDHDLVLAHKDNAGVWQNERRLTNWQGDELRPTVSPDGKHIAFYAASLNAKDRIWNLYVIPYVENKTFTATELAQMMIAENVVVDLNTGPAWTPDSQKIFFVKNDSRQFNPIHGYDLYTGRTYLMQTKAKMNRDLMVSSLGILSFRAQVGAWDRVFLALTNQGMQLQKKSSINTKVHYLKKQ